MDEGKRKALESLPRPSPIGLSQSMWTTICPFDPEVKLGGDADDGRILPLLERQQRPRTRWFGSDRLPE